MKKVWVVVANQTKARIYQAKNVHTLEEIQGFVHPEGHLHDCDLITDKSGRTGQSACPGTSTYQAKTSTHTKQAHLFATTIAHFLEEPVREKTCEKLYIIASPVFLGLLRETFSPQVKSVIAKEIPKDVVQFDVEQIRNYLPPIL